jgi:hypothetical protein
VSKESSEIFKGCVRQSNAEAGKKISYMFVEKEVPTVNLIKNTVELTKSGVSEINKYLIESNFKWVPHK